MHTYFLHYSILILIRPLISVHRGNPVNSKQNNYKSISHTLRTKTMKKKCSHFKTKWMLCIETLIITWRKLKHSTRFRVNNHWLIQDAFWFSLTSTLITWRVTPPIAKACWKKFWMHQMCFNRISVINIKYSAWFMLREYNLI